MTISYSDLFHFILCFLCEQLNGFRDERREEDDQLGFVGHVDDSSAEDYEEDLLVSFSEIPSLFQSKTSHADEVLKFVRFSYREISGVATGWRTSYSGWDRLRDLRKSC